MEDEEDLREDLDRRRPAEEQQEDEDDDSSGLGPRGQGP
jgi:hypothetical protein